MNSWNRHSRNVYQINTGTCYSLVTPVAGFTRWIGFWVPSATPAPIARRIGREILNLADLLGPKSVRGRRFTNDTETHQ